MHVAICTRVIYLHNHMSMELLCLFKRSVKNREGFAVEEKTDSTTFEIENRNLKAKFSTQTGTMQVKPEYSPASSKDHLYIKVPRWLLCTLLSLHIKTNCV